jgi:hypothetical protein
MPCLKWFKGVGIAVDYRLQTWPVSEDRGEVGLRSCSQVCAVHLGKSFPAYPRSELSKREQTAVSYQRSHQSLRPDACLIGEIIICCLCHERCIV